MSQVPTGVDRRRLTVVARRVLLDALDLLRAHLDGITVIGAQAVYLRTPDSSFAVAGYTRDADLALLPELVAHPPAIHDVLREQGFVIANPDWPGRWTRDEVVGDMVVAIPVDLLVPESLAGRGRRSAELPPHDKHTARRVPGIEAVLHDRTAMAVASLEPDVDPRVLTVHVADIASLLIAKAHKIDDRLKDVDSRPDRLTDKDAADVIRLFMAADPAEVRQRLDALQAIPAIAEVVRSGRAALIEQFRDERAAGVQMAVAALEGAFDSPADLAVAWVAALAEP